MKNITEILKRIKSLQNGINRTIWMGMSPHDEYLAVGNQAKISILKWFLGKKDEAKI